MEEPTQETVVQVKPKRKKNKFLRNFSITFIALSIGCVYFVYISTLHENYYHFSHLSELEREMTMHSESAFYYYFYKTIVQEKPFIAGLTKIMYDRYVEYPNEVNAFNRFNIYPEVITGALYLYLEPWLNTTAHRTCHAVSRGPGSPPVVSCVGIGEPIYFYLQATWLINSIQAQVMFLTGTLLSGSILGGLVTIGQFFSNYTDCCRSHLLPSLRESFAVPFLFLQMWLLTIQLRGAKNRTCFKLQLSIFVVNTICLLFWQFTQFIFLTQLAIFFLMEQLKIIDVKSLCVILHSHFSGLHTAVLLLHGNSMLKVSLYTSFFVVISFYALFLSPYRIKVKTKTDFLIESWLVLLRIFLSVFLSLYIKYCTSEYLGVKDDNHIWDLLYAKFTNYKSFHTLMYTCINGFGFMSKATILSYTITLALPFAVVGVLHTVYCWIKNAIENMNKKDETETASIETEKVETERIETDKIETDKIETADGNETDDSGIENNSETQLLRNRKIQTDLDKLDREVREKTGELEKEREQTPFLAFMKALDIDAAIFFNICQLAAFGILALMFNRLRNLFGPQLCVVASLVVNLRHNIIPKRSPHSGLKYWSRVRDRVLPAVAIFALFLGNMFLSVTRQLNVIGEFSDPSKEELLQWILRSTPASGVMAASIPLSAAILLSTRRAVLTQPHYETQEARDRCFNVNKMYGRFSPQELYETLNKMRATYLVFEKSFCYSRYRPEDAGCTFQDLYDIEVPSLRKQPSLCATLMNERTEHLYEVFQNRKYIIFRIHDLSVRYMPRVFDT